MLSSESLKGKFQSSGEEQKGSCFCGAFPSAEAPVLSSCEPEPEPALPINYKGFSTRNEESVFKRLPKILCFAMHAPRVLCRMLQLAFLLVLAVSWGAYMHALNGNGLTTGDVRWARISGKSIEVQYADAITAAVGPAGAEADVGHVLVTNAAAAPSSFQMEVEHEGEKVTIGLIRVGLDVGHLYVPRSTAFLAKFDEPESLKITLTFDRLQEVAQFVRQQVFTIDAPLGGEPNVADQVTRAEFNALQTTLQTLTGSLQSRASVPGLFQLGGSVLPQSNWDALRAAVGGSAAQLAPPAIDLTGPCLSVPPPTSGVPSPVAPATVPNPGFGIPAAAPMFLPTAAPTTDPTLIQLLQQQTLFQQHFIEESRLNRLAEERKSVAKSLYFRITEEIKQPGGGARLMEQTVERARVKLGVLDGMMPAEAVLGKYMKRQVKLNVEDAETYFLRMLSSLMLDLLKNVSAGDGDALLRRIALVFIYIEQVAMGRTPRAAQPFLLLPEEVASSYTMSSALGVFQNLTSPDFADAVTKLWESHAKAAELTAKVNKTAK